MPFLVSENLSQSDSHFYHNQSKQKKKLGSNTKLPKNKTKKKNLTHLATLEVTLHSRFFCASCDTKTKLAGNMKVNIYDNEHSATQHYWLAEHPVEKSMSAYGRPNWINEI